MDKRRLEMNLSKMSKVLLIIYALLTIYGVLMLILGLELSPMMTPLSTLVAFAFALTHSLDRLGWKHALVLFATTFLVSLFFESLGVATGWIYGKYHYSDILGVKVFGLVPLLIPIAWIQMSYPSFVIARRVLPRMQNLTAWRLALAAIGALVMTAWDVAMDPLMSGGGHWIWEEGGPYFGIPLQNFWGWWLTIFVTFTLFLWLTKFTPESHPPAGQGQDRLPILSYLLTGFGTIIGDLRFGLGGAALAGIFAMLPWILMGWLGNREE
jgi:putative membrane protein